MSMLRLHAEKDGVVGHRITSYNVCYTKLLRVGRPSERETLISRLIDRPLRPLFPKGFKDETQIIATVLSADRNTSPDVLALTGASAALHISSIPWGGPVACALV